MRVGGSGTAAIVDGGAAGLARSVGGIGARSAGCAEVGSVFEPATDDGLDLGQGPMEAGARQAVQERGQVRRFGGFEAASEQRTVGRLEADLDRSIP